MIFHSLSTKTTYVTIDGRSEESRLERRQKRSGPAGFAAGPVDHVRTRVYSARGNSGSASSKRNSSGGRHSVALHA